MKRLWLSLLVLVWSLPCLGYFSPKPGSPRCIEVGEKGVITLAQGGKASFEVVVPHKSHRSVEAAGALLCDCMNKMLGSDVKVTHKASGTIPAFIIGDKEAAARLNLDLEHLDQDGYYIVTEGQNIVIIGHDGTTNHDPRKGSTFGVLEFLERFGGVRFYFPGRMGTILPKKSDWVLPSIRIVDRPDNQNRKPYIVELLPRQGKAFYPASELSPAEFVEFSEKTLRYSSLTIPNCHGLAMLGYQKRFADTHPEVFALNEDGTRYDGRLVTRPSDVAGHHCFTNEFFKEQVYQDAKAFLLCEGDPKKEQAAAEARGVYWYKQDRIMWRSVNFIYPFFNIMPNDCLAQCHCPECSKIYAQGPQAVSEHIWKFKTDIARRLKAEGVKGFITVMAYSPYDLVPSVDIPDNVIVMLALMGPWKEAQQKSRDEGYQLLKKWYDKLGKNKIYMWNYATKCGNLIANIPNFTPRAVASFYQNTQEYSFGAMLESETDYWILGFMNYYMFSKVLWDSKVSADAILQEHCQLMYGAAAPLMLEFYDTLERHWLRNIMSNIRNTPLGPQAVLPSTYEIWHRIYSPEEVARVEKLLDHAEAAVSGDAEALERVRYMRRELWGHVLEGRREYEKANEDRSTWTIYASNVTAAPVMDGKLDDAVWKDADQVYMIPRSNEDVEVHTRVKMLCDKDNIYVGYECDEPQTDKMLCAKRKIDEVDIWKDNLVELFFAANGQSELLYQIMLNSDGMHADMIQAPGRDCDTSWNSGLECKVGVVPGKMWVAEMRVPRASMPDLKPGAFSVNFTRGRILNHGDAKTIYYVWSPFRKQFPEYCGTAIVGERPASKSLVKWYNREGRSFGPKKRFFGVESPGATVWGASEEILKDERCFRTGGSSLRLIPSPSNAIRQMFPGLKPNTKYRLSFFYRLENVVPSDNPHTGFWGIVRFCNTGKVVDYVIWRQHPVGTIEWQRHSCEFTTPDVVGDRGMPYIHFGLANVASGTAWVDQVELVPLEK